MGKVPVIVCSPHLPKTQEEHGLDTQELRHGVVRLKWRLEHVVEHAQAVERVTDAQIHSEREVQPPAGRAEVPLQDVTGSYRVTFALHEKKKSLLWGARTREIDLTKKP